MTDREFSNELMDDERRCPTWVQVTWLFLESNSGVCSDCPARCKRFSHLANINQTFIEDFYDVFRCFQTFMNIEQTCGKCLCLAGYQLSAEKAEVMCSYKLRPQPDNIFHTSQTSTKRSLKTFMHCFNVCNRLWTLNKCLKKVCVLSGSIQSCPT